ncbi:MAG: hypothetical protein J6J42_03815 [Lachnospiraceae bacterium]|nr:hypothetical protein [Lachnospiraceae bacterium]
MGLFDFFKKRSRTGETTSEKQKAEVPKVLRMPGLTITTEPDEPAFLGYKTSWLAVKNSTPEEVMEKLQLGNVQVANWESGLEVRRFGKVFVSPVMDGYVIVSDMEELADDVERLRETAGLFDEMLFFATYRIVDLHTWAKFKKGETVRRYYFLGESGEVESEGEMTPEERELGFGSYLTSEEDDWETVEFANEDSVMAISKAWGIDPWFESHKGERSTGFVAGYVKK